MSRGPSESSRFRWWASICQRQFSKILKGTGQVCAAKTSGRKPSTATRTTARISVGSCVSLKTGHPPGAGGRQSQASWESLSRDGMRIHGAMAASGKFQVRTARWQAESPPRTGRQTLPEGWDGVGLKSKDRSRPFSLPTTQPCAAQFYPHGSLMFSSHSLCVAVLQRSVRSTLPQP